MLLPSGNVGGLQSENFCSGLQKTIDLKGKAEHELMRSKILRVLKGYELRNVEDNLISTIADVQNLKTDVAEKQVGLA